MTPFSKNTSLICMANRCILSIKCLFLKFHVLWPRTGMEGCFYFNDIIQIYHLRGKHAPDGKHAPKHANFENFVIFIHLYVSYMEITLTNSFWWSTSGQKFGVHFRGLLLLLLVEKLIFDQNSIFHSRKWYFIILRSVYELCQELTWGSFFYVSAGFFINSRATKNIILVKVFIWQMF